MIHGLRIAIYPHNFVHILGDLGRGLTILYPVYNQSKMRSLTHELSSVSDVSVLCKLEAPKRDRRHLEI